jgi:hypothetical protein
MTFSPTIVIRHATMADAPALSDLAALDSRRSLAGPALLAEVDGIARAALDLSDGSVAADPFVPTLELVDLLRTRARRLEGAEPAPSLRRRALARLRRPRRALSRA